MSICIHIDVCITTCMCVYMCICIYTYIYIYIYIYIERERERETTCYLMYSILHHMIYNVKNNNIYIYRYIHKVYTDIK